MHFLLSRWASHKHFHDTNDWWVLVTWWQNYGWYSEIACMCSICRDFLCMSPTNERWRYSIRPSLIGWMHTQDMSLDCFYCMRHWEQIHAQSASAITQSHVTIFHTALGWERRNMAQASNLKKTTKKHRANILPSWVRYAMHLWILWNVYHVAMIQWYSYQCCIVTSMKWGRVGFKIIFY